VQDNCSTNVDYTDTSTFDADEIADNADDYNYVITRVWAVEDLSGNETTCTQLITVEDIEAPTATCPVDQTVDTDLGVCGATVDLGQPVTSDNCSGVSLVNDAPSLFPVGTTTVLWIVEDASGNTTECSHSITVEDNEAPVAICVDITVELDENGEYVVATDEIDGGSYDNCNNITRIKDVASLSCSLGETFVITLDVWDNNGNDDYCEATVTMLDNVAPVALCQDLTLQLDANGEGSITASQIDNGSNDACGIESLELSKTDFLCEDAGPNAIVLSVTDSSNNVSTCESTVTVEDNVSPIASCKDVIVTGDENGDGFIDASDIDNGSSDACGVTLEVSQEIFSCVIGNYDVTLTVTDANGNSAQCDATVSLIGNDSDCDSHLDGCDECYGGDDTVDNNGDGLPDCAYPPAFNDIIDDWKCGNKNKKLQVCHVPPGNPNNVRTICISKNAVPTHVPNHGGDYIGPCFAVNCDNAAPVSIDYTHVESDEDYTPDHEGHDHAGHNHEGHSHSHNHGPLTEQDFRVFPNPTSQELFMTLRAEADTQYKLIVFDNAGQLVWKNDYDNDGVKRVDVSNWIPGVYTLKMISKSIVVSKTIIVVE